MHRKIYIYHICLNFLLILVCKLWKMLKNLRFQPYFQANRQDATVSWKMADCTRLLKQRKGLHEHGSTCSTKLHENNSVNSACPSFHKGHVDGPRCMTLTTHKMCPLYLGNLKYFIIDSKQICSFSGDRHYFFYNFFFFFFFFAPSNILFKRKWDVYLLFPYFFSGKQRVVDFLPLPSLPSFFPKVLIWEKENEVLFLFSFLSHSKHCPCKFFKFPAICTQGGRKRGRKTERQGIR